MASELQPPLQGRPPHHSIRRSLGRDEGGNSQLHEAWGTRDEARTQVSQALGQLESHAKENSDQRNSSPDRLCVCTCLCALAGKRPERVRGVISLEHEDLTPTRTAVLRARGYLRAWHVSGQARQYCPAASSSILQISSSTHTPRPKPLYTSRNGASHSESFSCQEMHLRLCGREPRVHVAITCICPCMAPRAIRLQRTLEMLHQQGSERWQAAYRGRRWRAPTGM